MTTATQTFGFDTRDGVPRVHITRDQIRGEEIFGHEDSNPFLTIVEKTDPIPDRDDRRHRLACLLDDWTATVTLPKSAAEGLIETMGEGMEPYLTVAFSPSIKEGLEGHICAPLGRFAAVGVAHSGRRARASIGTLHSADTLDQLGGKLLIDGMGLPENGWSPDEARYLVMNLDRDLVDPSLHLSNLIDGLLFAERSWPEA